MNKFLGVQFPTYRCFTIVRILCLCRIRYRFYNQRQKFGHFFNEFFNFWRIFNFFIFLPLTPPLNTPLGRGRFGVNFAFSGNLKLFRLSGGRFPWFLLHNYSAGHILLVFRQKLSVYLNACIKSRNCSENCIHARKSVWSGP
jgi:hypothetical protein